MSDTRRIYCHVSWVEMFRDAIRFCAENPGSLPDGFTYPLKEESFESADEILTDAIEGELPEVRMVDLAETLDVILSRLNNGVCNVAYRYD